MTEKVGAQAVQQLDHLNLTVKNLQESLGFYRELFAFEVAQVGEDEPYPWRIIKSGDAMLCLYEHPELPEGPHYPTPPTQQEMRHFALRIADGPSFFRLVKQLGVELAYGGPVRWPHSTSYYLSDPSGYQIEVVAWDEDTIRFDALG